MAAVIDFGVNKAQIERYYQDAVLDMNSKPDSTDLSQFILAAAAHVNDAIRGNDITPSSITMVGTPSSYWVANDAVLAGALARIFDSLRRWDDAERWLKLFDKRLERLRKGMGLHEFTSTRPCWGSSLGTDTLGAATDPEPEEYEEYFTGETLQ